MRIGVYHFLNVQPLAWDLAKHHQVIEAAPNQMAKMLKDGRLDVAIAPMGAYVKDNSLQIVPIAAVGCKGPVKTVRMLSYDPLPQTQRLFVDDRSETSVLLARLILKKWNGVKGLKVVPVDMEHFHPNQVKPWEVVLQFGDIALESAPSGMTVTDLGEEWFLRTQLPFIFAVWMTNSVPIAREIEQDLLSCRNEGVKHYQEIADNYKGLWVFHHAQAKEYLEKNIRYEYGPEEAKGHQEFQRLLKEEGLIF
jgi:chorismate dehydratase